eukprot:363239-Rhodomonas_salina.1
MDPTLCVLMQQVQTKRFGGRLSQLFVGNADLARLRDGCPNALGNELITLLVLDVQSKEVLLQGLVADGAADAKHKRECVDTAYTLDVLLRLPLLSRLKAVILVPRPRELKEIEGTASLMPGQAVRAPIRLVHVARGSLTFSSSLLLAQPELRIQPAKSCPLAPPLMAWAQAKVALRWA